MEPIVDIWDAWQPRHGGVAGALSDPARIRTGRGGVGRVVAARARADGHYRAAVVLLAVEQRLHLQVADRLLQRRELGARLDGAVPVVHLEGELDGHLEVVDALLDGRDPLELGVLVAERARDLLRVRGVVPQVGRAGLL